LLFKYARNTASQNPWKGRMARVGLPSEKETRLKSEESRKSQLWPTDDIEQRFYIISSNS
jgi:hypothetical protein